MWKFLAFNHFKNSRFCWDQNPIFFQEKFGRSSASERAAASAAEQIRKRQWLAKIVTLFSRAFFSVTFSGPLTFLEANLVDNIWAARGRSTSMLRFSSFLMFSDSFLPNLFKLKRLWMIESKCVQTIFGSASHVRLFVFIHNFFWFPLCQPFFVHTVFLFFVNLTTTCRRLISVEKRSVDFTTCIK